jgi:hypothetical protein
VVRGEDGSVSWKPGCNLCIRIPASDEESWFPGSIAVRDAWDDSFRSIEVGASLGLLITIQVDCLG